MGPSLKGPSLLRPLFVNVQIGLSFLSSSTKVWTDFPMCWLCSFLSFFFPPCGLPWWRGWSLSSVIVTVIIVTPQEVSSSTVWCVFVFSGDHNKGGIWSYGEPAPRGTAVCPRGIWVSTSVFYLWLGVHFSALWSKNAWCVNQVGGNYRIYRANTQRRVESDQKYLMLATLFMSFIVGIIFL